MSPRGWKIANALIVVLLAGYAAVAIRYCSGREQQQKCTGVVINIRDSAELGFVTPEIVRKWLADSAVKNVGLPLREVNVYQVEQLVGAKDYVSEAEAYTAIDGLLHIEIRQRRPLMRVVTEAGHNFYVDSTLTLLPPEAYCIADVPVVSGRLPLGFPVGYYGVPDEKKFSKERGLLHNLLNFVHQVDSDDFLRALVSQIYFSDDEIVLLPRIGGQIVRFGRIDQGADVVASRLGKLSQFYRRSFSEGWWREAREVDLRFRGQVVCKMRPGYEGVGAVKVEEIIRPALDVGAPEN